MNRWVRLGIVGGGYAAAGVLAFLAGWVNDRRLAALPYDTSGGMYAGGQMILQLGVFLLVALAPTALALWWLRNHRGLWTVVAAGALSFALAGLLAVMSFLVHPGTSRGLGPFVLEMLGLAQLLGAPFWALAFTLLAWLAPRGGPRRAMFAAVVVQLASCAFAALHWLTSLPRS
jgi:hypothetical protein